MSYAGPDPAMSFPKCPDCGEDADFSHSPEQCEKNRLPKVRIVRPNMTCGTCGKMLWDCGCFHVVDCDFCYLDVDDAKEVGVFCEYSPTGKHVWRVDDGDGYRILK